MPEKSPEAWSLFAPLWVVVISVWGGFVSYISKIRNGAKFSFLELVAEIMTAGFMGMLTFWMCQTAQLNDSMTGVFVGVGSHMGSRGLMILSEKYRKQFGN